MNPRTRALGHATVDRPGRDELRQAPTNGDGGGGDRAPARLRRGHGLFYSQPMTTTVVGPRCMPRIFAWPRLRFTLGGLGGPLEC